MSGMRIAVTGASGLIGTALSAFLCASSWRGGGHTVVPLVRRSAKPGEVAWDPVAGTVETDALDGVDAVVHLAGENVAGGRWTAARRERILRSRTDGTRTIATALALLRRKPTVLVSASAVGWYGSTGDMEVDEASPPGSGFLSEVCRAWEAAADPAREAGIRVLHARLGVVLSGRGGALPEMARPFRFGVGGPIGGGRQWLPWVAIADVIGAILHAIASPLEGPVNVVSPNPVRQATFARVLGHVLHRPALLPLPALAVRGLFGRMGQEILLDGQRVKPAHLIASGYVFEQPDLEGALRFALAAP